MDVKLNSGEDSEVKCLVEKASIILKNTHTQTHTHTHINIWS